MVTTSGLSHTPVTRVALLVSIALSILAAVLDVQYLVPLKPTPHLWPYLQFSRLLTYQTAATSSTELLFATVLLYQFRVLERLWGSRKYASFLVVVWWLDVLLVPALCLLLKLATWGWYNYVPGGLTGLVFAGLSVWGDEVPRLARYKILVDGHTKGGVLLSDKSSTYLLAAQLALSQFPYNLLPAAVGWAVGTAWTGELLPAGLARWRVPAWLVGESARRKERGQFEGLRRRLEEEGSSADGMRNVSDNVGGGGGGGGQESARRGFGRQILGYFTGN